MNAVCTQGLSFVRQRESLLESLPFVSHASATASSGSIVEYEEGNTNALNHETVILYESILSISTSLSSKLTKLVASYSWQQKVVAMTSVAMPFEI